MGQYTQDELMFNDKLASRHRYNTRGFNAAPLTLKTGSSASGTGLANYTASSKWIAHQVFHSTNTTGGDGSGQQWGASRDSGNRTHKGIDIQTHEKGIKYVYPIGPGHIKQFNIAPNQPGGNTVTVYHGNGIYSEYMHLAKSDIKLTIGQEVTNDTPIGIEGNTGKRNNSSKPYAYHLHFGIYQNNTKNRLNPTSPETQKLIRGLFKEQGSSTGTSNQEIDNGSGKTTPNKKLGRAPIHEDYEIIIQKAAMTYNLDLDILRGLIYQESKYDPKAESRSGAKGLAQLMPATANELGVTDPFDPGQSINAGAHYLRKMLDLKYVNQNYQLALAAYNAGPGNVQKYNGLPPFAETNTHRIKILEYAGKNINWQDPSR